MRISTDKILGIMQSCCVGFSIIVAIVGRLTIKDTEAQLNLLSNSFKISVVIVFIVCSILLSVYCYFWGKSSGESCTKCMSIKGPKE